MEQDNLMPTTSSDEGVIFAQAFTSEAGTKEKKVVLINKTNSTASVVLENSSGGRMFYLNTTDLYLI